MPRCPQCAHDAPVGSRFCPRCAQPLGGAPPVDATRTSLPEVPARPVSISAPRGGSESRFLPGTIVAGRYRIVGMLGRGGMGEVYRADDMKLGQGVALKFLPAEVEHDPARLERFLNEVRLALRITHPNVCRVHDIGEVDASTSSGPGGHHFISMEYVDGEDLASLLRRIGRLPEERGVEIARQICAGLAAAHEQGILHRDLKPANVMIDGRGRARITDFGLAGLAGTVEGDEARAGTPAYMAPEQHAGGEVTMRSDVYALGLVLYEVFTGKPAFTARTAGEMARMQQSTTPTTPTSHVQGLDPAIDAVLLRCLDPDPARRPASAVAVAAALPGGDPLAAALAAGETPSPEMVAEAGRSDGMAPMWVALSVLAIVAIAIAAGLLRPYSDVLGSIETPHSITALRERARLMSERLGLDVGTVDTAHGLTFQRDYVDWLQDHERAGTMRERVAAERPPVYLLWYRESPRPLVPSNVEERVQEDDPPAEDPGMVSLHLDAEGRLVELAAVPPDRDEEAVETASPEEVWAALFAEAGLDPERFERVEPSRTPPFFADARAAWEGTLAEAEDLPLRVEAAAFHGRPVSFRIVGPWSRDRGDAGPPEWADRVMPYVAFLIFVGVMVGLGLLARRNLNSSRSDLRGARRVALFIFSIELVSAVIRGGIFIAGSNVMDRFMTRLAFVVLVSMITFLSYIALEPYVRRLWPTTLISWTRLVAGRFADPLVGRDLLIGGALGALSRFLWVAHTRLPGLLGLPTEPLGVGAADAAESVHVAITELLSQAGGAVGLSMLQLLVLVLLRLLLRNTWAAIGVYAAIVLGLGHLGSPHIALDTLIQAAVTALALFVILRVGLLALMAMWFFDMGLQSVRSLDPSSWVWSTSVVYLVGMALVTTWAAVVALGGRSVLQDDL